MFRTIVRIDAEPPRVLGHAIQPWQARDFAALDPAWLALAGFGHENPSLPAGGRRQGEGGGGPRMEAQTLPAPPPCPLTPNPAPPQGDSAQGGAGERAATLFRRAYLERPRGHAKTSDLAVELLWLLAFGLRRIEGLAAAADRDQAGLLKQAIERLAQLNPWVGARLDFRQHAVINPRSGSRLEVISSDVQSSWGALPDFVICDELCHWDKPELWYSLFSSAAKRPDAVLVVLSNAGWGRSWQWQVREMARQQPDWYFASLDGPQAPWIAPEMLAEQRALLPPSVFERLWMNRWQDTTGDFVTLEEAEACRDPALAPQDGGRRGVAYVAAVDYAEKRDRTVGVVLHRQGDRFVVDRMDVAVPEPTRPVTVQWVREWIERTARAFGDVTFVVDEYQLLAVIQELEHLDVHRFDFRGGTGNHRLAAALRELIVSRRLAWYPDCGAIAGSAALAGSIHTPSPPLGGRGQGEGGVGSRTQAQPSPPAAGAPEGPAGRDDLETELAGLIVKPYADGTRWRITHVAAGHDDRAFALGAACLHALERLPAGEEFIEVTPPAPDGGFSV